MVKFKMKVLLILGLSACMTISMILYIITISRSARLDLLNLKVKDFVKLNGYTKNNSVSNTIMRDSFGRNPVSSFSDLKLQKGSRYTLVDTSFSNVSFMLGTKVKNLFLNGLVIDKHIGLLNNTTINKKRSQSNSSIYTVKSLKESPVRFLNNSESDLILITGAEVVPSTIDHMIDNKTILKDFKSRRDGLLSECSKMYNSTSMLTLKKEKLDHILVDEKNKVLFCYIPKVACTNWRRMFLLLTGKSKNISYVTNLPSYEIHAKNRLPSLQNYSANDVHLFVRNYKKVIFVRNPLERLLSAYRNKLEQHYNSSKYFQARFGKYIVKNFRVNPSNASLLKGDDVTFTEFVTYLISSPTAQYNEHWQTMNDLCHPCFLKYDIIGKYDTLMSDAKSVLSMFHVNYSFPVLPKPSRTAASLNDYYKQLSPELISKLYLIYEMDFRLFNYSIAETLRF